MHTVARSALVDFAFFHLGLQAPARTLIHCFLALLSVWLSSPCCWLNHRLA